MAATPGTEMKRTLTMTGLTINAMALIAPGAFLWTTFQAQVVQQMRSDHRLRHGPGLLFVLVLAFLTAFSYSELANLYPEAGAGSSYYFAEAAFLGREEQIHYKFARLAKSSLGGLTSLLLDLSGHHGCVHRDSARVHPRAIWHRPQPAP